MVKYKGLETKREVQRGDRSQCTQASKMEQSGQMCVAANLRMHTHIWHTNSVEADALSGPPLQAALFWGAHAPQARSHFPRSFPTSHSPLRRFHSCQVAPQCPQWLCSACSASSAPPFPSGWEGLPSWGSVGWVMVWTVLT